MQRFCYLYKLDYISRQSVHLNEKDRMLCTEFQIYQSLKLLCDDRIMDQIFHEAIKKADLNFLRIYGLPEIYNKVSRYD